jgi:hypothetical protein
MTFRKYDSIFNRFLKVDTLSQWIDEAWISQQGSSDFVTIWSHQECTNDHVLAKVAAKGKLPGGFQYHGYMSTPSPIVAPTVHVEQGGEIVNHMGAYLYHFKNDATAVSVDILMVATYINDHGQTLCLASVPQEYVSLWSAFTYECQRLAHTLEPTSRVVVIGGNTYSFVPSVNWEDVILPQDLKHDIMENVQSFFTTGVEVYKRLKLKPFRKLLLAGVPGTGKTMLCAALAKWALEQQYLVIYISSGDRNGPTFHKIEQALAIASNSNLPTLILLEEMDAYLHPQQKALVLNVLDGAESLRNDRGTLLIATTNYPEAIDERILKRPGRLDRIFIIPELRDAVSAEKMLRMYLNEMWRDELMALVPQLVGFPGAFVREVAIYAMTQVAYDDLHELTLDVLQRSFDSLKDQIDARDEFLVGKYGDATTVPESANGYEAVDDYYEDDYED